MLVSIETKVKILDEIIADDGEGMFEGWDGTFSGLHDFVDANDYIYEVFVSYLPDFDKACDACNEVMEWLNESFKELRQL